MQRLCLSHHYTHQLVSPSTEDINTLSHVRIDDNGNIIAVFNDDSELDVTSLFSESMIDDYREHKILERC
ncbi:MAG: hypothetical protein HUJ29_12965 [Gammaproteobacteria bacterium]|nr:hypothetical protein [Gammaproteobacteria bacterium]